MLKLSTVNIFTAGQGQKKKKSTKININYNSPSFCQFLKKWNFFRFFPKEIIFSNIE